VREGPQPIEPPPPPVEAVPLPAAPPPPPPTPPRRPAARVSPSLAALLSSAEGLRHAFIVREILDPPLCKRRR
ncbi:MAG TPA: hypothetical protein VNK04_11490, partial [Gemmataceae bacterium]|nr:hypothetical protein [Gemmataceae bacterium]